MAAVIEARGIQVRYGLVTALSDVEISVSAGEIVALVGPNGAGKTTLLRTLCGLIVPCDGTISIGGRRAKSRWALASLVAYVPTEPRFPRGLSVASWLRLKTSLLDMDSAKRKTLAEEIEQRIGPLRKRKVDKLSRGERLQLALATELSGEPRVIAADEPWSGLDPLAREMVLAKLAERAGKGAAILVSSHDLAGLAEIAARFVFLHKGKIRKTVTQSWLREQAELASTTPDRILLKIYRDIVEGESESEEEEER